MDSMQTGVRVQCTVADPDGASRFADVILPYATSQGPMRATAPVPAVSLSFRWTPGDFDMPPQLAPRRRLVLVTEGAVEITVSNGESRVFRPGDVLSIGDTWGQGHSSRAVGGAFRSAFITLERDLVVDRRVPMSAPDPDGIDYVHNQETPAGISYFQEKRMPFVYGGAEGKETAEIALRSYQFVLAGGDLDYDWHPAPQRQAVLVLTGGLGMEYGDGSQARVPPGGFLIGEDTDGKGHITRAIQGRPRFSVFAHLA